MPTSNGVDRADLDQLTAQLEAIIEDEDTERDITLHELSNREVLTLMTVLMDGRERFVSMGAQYQADMLARMVISIRSQTDDIHEPMEDTIESMAERGEFDGFDDGGYRPSRLIQFVDSYFGLFIAFIALIYGVLSVANFVQSGMVPETSFHILLATIAVVMVSVTAWFLGRSSAQTPF